jgi:predicted metal-dependent phosphoesterase TrpH
MSTAPTVEPVMRCDLHVHSRFSGAVDLPLLRHVGYECYSEPREVYDAARRMGMDFVTLTDHDSIEGAVELLSLPGTFVSE